LNKPEEIKQDSDEEKEIEDDLLAKQYNNSYKIITNNILTIIYLILKIVLVRNQKSLIEK
jgi:hypothetical protein